MMHDEHRLGVRFRLAEPSDLKDVIGFYDIMIEAMRGSDFDAYWRKGVHPSEDYLRDAISNRSMLIGEWDLGNGRRSRSGGSPGPTARPVQRSQEGPIRSENHSDDPVEGSIVGALVMDGNIAPGYERVPWMVDAEDGEFEVLHLVATHPGCHGRGIAKAMVMRAIESAEERGVRSIRLDTFPTNERSQRLYESCGFRCLGDHALHYEELGERPFVIYEYAIEHPGTNTNGVGCERERHPGG